MNLEKDFTLFAADHGVSKSVLEDYAGAMFKNQYIEPTIMEERQLNVTQLSVFSRLLMERILILGTEINPDVANIIISQLLYLETTNPNKQISMYINSPGGSVYDGMGIYDVMKIVTCPISTTCMCMAASMGAVLLAGGDKGLRYSLPHSTIMLHSPSGGTGRVTAPDMRIAAREMEKCEDMLYRVLSEDTGKDYEYIKKICDRDYWLTPEEAIKEGVIDQIISRTPKK